MSNYTVPNNFASQSGNVPASQLDANFTACLLGINNAYLSGTEASKPAASTDGRYYYATDTNILWRDNGTSWVAISPGYVTGTWTPSIGGTATYTTQLGTYTKIGRLIQITCQLQILALGTGSRSIISGLPAPAVGVQNATLACVWSTGALAAVYIVGVIGGGNSFVSLYGLTAASNTVNPINFLGSGASIGFVGTYQWQ